MCIMFLLYLILCHVVTVTIIIVVDPAGNGDNRQYKLAAGSLDLALTLASVPTGSGPASSNMGSNSSIVMRHGFDFFRVAIRLLIGSHHNRCDPRDGEIPFQRQSVELVYSAPGAATSRNTEISCYSTLLENHISILDGGSTLQYLHASPSVSL